MPPRYSQIKASLAIAKASLLATLKSPTSVVFSLLFPIIFVTVFGAMVDNTAVKIKMVLLPSDNEMSDSIYAALKQVTIFDLSISPDSARTMEDLKKGRIGGALKPMVIIHDHDSFPDIKVNLFTSVSVGDKLPLIQAALGQLISQANKKILPDQKEIVHLETIDLPGRAYRPIDFILPGQLGFSLLMAGVFGSAYLLFSLRHGLVLKRLYATPIQPMFLLLGELLSRLLFQIICFLLITALGYYAFHFTLVHGVATFAEMLVLSVFALIVFTGIGFLISGAIRNESSIAPVANTFTIPQILLCGLFFPIENYPAWLRGFCDYLPLTFFVDGLRKIAFEGLHIWQIPLQLSGLIVWIIVITLLCIKSFKWE